MQFSEIILSKKELSLLKRLLDEKQIRSLSDAEIFDHLVYLGFTESDFTVQSTSDPSDCANIYVITELGRSYLVYYRDQCRREAREWARYIVTTAIALVALITSIFAIARPPA